MKKALVLALSAILVFGASSSNLASGSQPSIQNADLEQFCQRVYATATDEYQLLKLDTPEGQPEQWEGYNKDGSIRTLIIIDEALPQTEETLSAECNHLWVSITETLQSRTCTEERYTLVKKCDDCNAEIQAGSRTVFLSPASHSMSYVTVACAAKPGRPETHTYENRCSRCGYASDSLSVACNGGCVSGELIVLPDRE